MVRDFERSKGDLVIQQADKATGLPLWVIEVIDADPEARQRTVKVKVAAEYQPMLPITDSGVAVHGDRVRGPAGHPVGGHRPVQGQGNRQVRRPDGVLAQGDRGAGTVTAARPPGA